MMYTIGFILFLLVVAFIAISFHRWMMKVIRPRESGWRQLFFFVVMLVAALMLTVAFSYALLLILKPSVKG